MGFLKKFFRGVFHEGAQAALTHSSFERLSEDELEAHLGVQRYGRFTLTDAIRPSYDLTKFSTQVGTDLTRRTPVTAGLAYEIGYQELTVTGTRSIEDIINGIDQRVSRQVNNNIPAGYPQNAREGMQASYRIPGALVTQRRRPTVQPTAPQPPAPLPPTSATTS